MVEQHLKPSYNEIMRELGIEIINPEKSQSVTKNKLIHKKQGKTGLILQNLKSVSKIQNRCLFLRYQEGKFQIRIYRIISQNREKGGISS